MKILAITFLVIILSFPNNPENLSGKWRYAGDIENGRKDNGPTDYILERVYDKVHFTAYAIQKGYKTEKYEIGNYILSSDSCIETQTWCSQDSKLLNIPVDYHYSFRKDTLVLAGILPTGAHVEEYWKRVK